MLLERALLLALGLLVGLTLLEAGVRLLGLAPQLAPIVIDQPYASFVSSPNPLLPYVPKPGSPGISAWGIRDREYSLDKPAGTHRTLVLGDSIGFGLCSEREVLAREHVFAEVLERRLDADPLPGYERAEVINLSVSGYDTIQEVAFLREKGLAFDPDLVVVGYCLNDNEDSSLELERMRTQAGWGALEVFGSRAVETIFEWSHLARAVWYRLALLREAEQDAPEGSDSRRSIGFQSLRDLADLEGFETMVVIFPYLDGSPRYSHADLHQGTRASAEAQGFQVLDLLEAFQRASGGHLPVLRGRCLGMHPDERGHRIAAHQIERAIRQAYADRARTRAPD